MKVKSLINSYNLTKNQIYEVISKNSNGIVVMGDVEKECTVLKGEYEVINE